MGTKITVEFEVADSVALEEALHRHFEQDENVVGMRSGVDPAARSSLVQFSRRMEEKLRKNDHKTNWRDLPIEALFRQMLIEIEEYKVAHEFLTVAEARNELVDVSNYALILWDRLSLEKQEDKVGKRNV